MQKLNILLLGQTGAGKSSFINYLAGEKIAPVSDGEPQTQGFDEYPLGENLRIIDSRGLEHKEADSQGEEILDYLEERYESEDIFEWIHLIFYCVSAASARFEPAEAEFVEALWKVSRMPVCIAITQCDTKSEQNIGEFKGEIKRVLAKGKYGEDFKFFDIVSGDKSKKSGEVATQRGREDVANALPALLANNIAKRVASEYGRIISSGYERLINALEAAIEGFIEGHSGVWQIAKEDSSETLSRLRTAADKLARELVGTEMEYVEEIDDELIATFSCVAQAYNACKKGYMEEKDAQTCLEMMELDFSSVVSEAYLEVLNLSGAEIVEWLFPSVRASADAWKLARVSANWSMEDEAKKTLAKARERMDESIDKAKIQGMAERKIAEFLDFDKFFALPEKAKEEALEQEYYQQEVRRMSEFVNRQYEKTKARLRRFWDRWRP